MDFVAIDVETANADLASICQIGVASVQSGRVDDQWSTLVDPEDYFDPINIAIHGINEDRVRGAPTFAKIYSDFQSRAAGPMIVSHTGFDRVAIAMAAEKHGLSLGAQTWLDSARVVRRAWPDKYAIRGYGLANVAADLGISFKHHDAGEDAQAAAEIILRASDVAALDLDGWIERVRHPISSGRPTSSESTAPIRREGNPEGALYGECLCFTGALEIPRREAADLASMAGCNVESGVTKNTTLLVVGDQDIQRLAGHDKSSKHRKAEGLIAKGQPIRILRETDFKKIVSLD